MENNRIFREAMLPHMIETYPETILNMDNLIEITEPVFKVLQSVHNNQFNKTHQL